MDWLGASAQIGSAAINGGFGMAMQKRQQKYTQENMDKAHQQNEESADNADKRKRAFYTDFESPEAVMRQLKEAGLSPGLFYGGSGTAGMNASGGAQGGGMSAPIGAGYVNPGLGLDLSAIQLNEAQARKLNTEADALEGKNAGGQADIAAKLAEAGYKTAQTAYTNAQTDYTEAMTVAQKFTNDLTDEARADILDDYRWRVKSMQANYEKAMSETKQNNELLELLKQKMGAEINEIMSQATLNITKNQVAKEEINKIIAETWSTWAQCENEKHKYEWFQRELETRLKTTGMMKSAIIISGAIGAGANVVKGLVDIFNPAKGLAKMLSKSPTKNTFGGAQKATEQATGYWGLFD